MFVLIIIGCCLPIIRFNFKGVAGIAFGLISENLQSREESIVSIGVSIINGAPKNNVGAQLGIVFMQIIYMLFALIVPLMVCALFIAIWAVPMTLQEQLLMYFVTETASAWEALAVMVFSVIATTLQISILAQFIVAKATGSLCDLAKAPLSKIFPDPEDAQCFDVQAELVIPSGLLITIVAFFMIFWVMIAFRLVHVALTDRELAMRRKPPHSPGEMTGLTGFIIRRALEAFGPGGARVEEGGVQNQFGQAVGAFDTQSAYPSQSYPQSYGGGNPVLANELAAGNPMFSGMVAPAEHGYSQQSKRTSIEV
jgi:hypothetical protein